MKTAVWLARFIVGATFLVSGAAKMIDPIGTLTKIEAYLAAWGIGDSISMELALMGGCILSVIEFVVGLLVFTGSLRRSAPLAATLIMAFMLPLTAYIAIANPVDDCGCFGDFLVMSNWATFAKNAVLMALCIFLLRKNTKARYLFKPWTQWIQVAMAIVYMFAIGIAGYHVQPLIDFRAYPVGEPLEDAQGPEVTYVYRDAEGNICEFADDELPDDGAGWEFVDVRQVTEPSEKMLSLIDRNTGEDVTDAAIGVTERQLILLIPEPSAATAAGSYTANELYEYMTRLYGPGAFIAVTDAKPDAVDEALDLMMAEYPVYYADPKAIKAVARGDMAVVCLENGIVSWKRTLSSINLDRLSAKNADVATVFALEGAQVFRRYTLMLVAAELLLAAMGFIPGLWRLRSRRKHLTAAQQQESGASPQ